MSSMDIEMILSNLTNLLNDICSFLEDENEVNLSVSSRKYADSLINRSKQQLQEISKISDKNETNNTYVDMDRKDGQDASIEEVSQDKSTEICPYKDLPAKQMNTQIKCGDLCWKRRRLLWIFSKDVYAGIHNKWLLIYSSKKSSKPLLCLDLKLYESRKIDEESGFQVVNKIDEKDVYNFQGCTAKDADDWHSKINLCYGSIDAMDDEIYSVQVIDPEMQDEDIYQSIDENPNLPKTFKMMSPSENQPPLPDRGLKNQLIFKSTSNDSLDTYEKLVVRNYDGKGQDLDDKDDETYDKLVTQPIVAGFENKRRLNTFFK